MPRHRPSCSCTTATCRSRELLALKAALVARGRARAPRAAHEEPQGAARARGGRRLHGVRDRVGRRDARRRSSSSRSADPAGRGALRRRVTRLFSRTYTSRRTRATTSPAASVMSVSNHSSTFAPPRARSRSSAAFAGEHLEVRREHAAAGLDELDLAAGVPHDVVAAELVHHEHEEVRVGHRRHRAAERGLDVVAGDDVDVQLDGRARPVVGEARTRMPLNRLGTTGSCRRRGGEE